MPFCFPSSPDGHRYGANDFLLSWLYPLERQSSAFEARLFELPFHLVLRGSFECDYGEDNEGDDQSSDGICHESGIGSFADFYAMEIFHATSLLEVPCSRFGDSPDFS